MEINLGKEKNRIKIYYHIIALLALVYFIVFLKIDSFPMRWWDESLFAVNTYEMMHNGKYFSVYFDNLPDIWNTKPPLTCWTQIFSVKFFGYNELALRLPSAIAACLSIIAVFLFVAKSFNIVWAWLSALILLTSSGFIHFHTARTADSDSLLTFFILITNLFFIKYILYNNKRDIFIFFIFIAFAFSTKLYAALLFIPAYVIILVVYKKLKEFIWNKFFLMGFFFFLVSSSCLLYLRELDTPGYLNEIFFKDAGRIFKVVEAHAEVHSFYFDNLFKSRFSTWWVLFLLGALFTFISKNEIEKKLLRCLFIFIAVYLCIITVSITKLEWYDMPLFPYLAIVASYPLYLLFQTIEVKQYSTSAISVIFIVVIFFYPYHMMFDKSQANKIGEGEKKLEANERYIFKSISEGKDLNNVKVYYYGYNGSLLFYKYKLQEANQKLQLVKTAKFNKNDKVLLCNDSLKKVMINNYRFDILDKHENAQLILIKEIIER